MDLDLRPLYPFNPMFMYECAAPWNLNEIEGDRRWRDFGERFGVTFFRSEEEREAAFQWPVPFFEADLRRGYCPRTRWVIRGR